MILGMHVVNELPWGWAGLRAPAILKYSLKLDLILDYYQYSIISVIVSYNLNNLNLI